MITPSLADRLAQARGPLFFPVTAFGPDGSLDLDIYRTHVRQGVEAGAAAVFACCGTGEFHALNPDEYGAAVAAAVSVTAGAVPVVAGAGYGTALAIQYARGAERSGADGLLVLPPYLVLADQAGLVRHYTALAAATPLDVLVYQRDNAVFTPDTVATLARTDGIVGLKDGLGDLDLLQRIISGVRRGGGDEDFLYLNGLPTAELTGPAYQGVGVTLYSSAVFAFAPDIALAFHRALADGDDGTVRGLLDGFYAPLVELRNQGRGYAVSLVKAGVRLAGLDVGGVRPPLSDPTPAHVTALAALVAHGRALLAGDATDPGPDPGPGSGQAGSPAGSGSGQAGPSAGPGTAPRPSLTAPAGEPV
ncbi:5-dehydro-4-deoxyglucarate dehydratase [Streptomyces sp. NPDC057638]|uniref:5-dehydro-4-deoxyglucarate dehydratase n=1 Tax=Streptomyces sp. NPDC057638 TaxID=3346190 RepID=UPI003681D779